MCGQVNTDCGLQMMMYASLYLGKMQYYNKFLRFPLIMLLKQER